MLLYGMSFDPLAMCIPISVMKKNQKLKLWGFLKIMNFIISDYVEHGTFYCPSEATRARSAIY